MDSPDLFQNKLKLNSRDQDHVYTFIMDHGKLVKW